MSRHHDQHPPDLPVAVVHPARSRVRVLVVDRDGSALRIVHAGETSTSGVSAEIARHGAKRIVQVLPASEAITRTCTLPAAGDGQLEAALRLQAETYLLGRVPEHRLGLAALAAAEGETGRPGLIIGWPERAGGSVTAPDLEGGDVPVRYTSEVTGLAGLLGDVRPAVPLVHADPASGAIAVALVHAGGVAFRGVGDDLSSDAPAVLRRLVTETALTAGHGAAFAARMFEPLAGEASSIGTSARLLCPDEVEVALEARVVDLPGDVGSDVRRDWLATWGLALGVGLAATGPMSGLCEIERSHAVEAPGPIERITTTLSTPRAAVAMVIAAVLLLGLGPAIASGIKLAVLEAKHPDAREQRRMVDDTRITLAMLDGLDDRAWSMTKILADITANTPDGVEFDTMRISSREQSFLVTGTAADRGGMSGPELLDKMLGDLSRSGPFSQVEPDWEISGQLGYVEFTFSGQIDRPHLEVDYPVDRDYGRWTLADRRVGNPPPGDDEESGDDDAPDDAVAANDGDDGTPPRNDDGGERTTGTPPDGAVADAGDERSRPSTSRPSSSRPPRAGGVGGTAEGGVAGGSAEARREGTASVTIPEPLSDAQIATMSRPEALEHLSKLREAKARVDREEQPELYERVDREWTALLAHLRELGRGGDS